MLLRWLIHAADVDGTLIRTDRVAERDPDTGYHL